MVIGDEQPLTKQEIQDAIDAAKEMLDGLTKRYTAHYIGHFNIIFLTLEKAKRHADE